MSTVVIRYDGTDITDIVLLSQTVFNAQVNGNAGDATVRVKRVAGGTFTPVAGKTLTLDVDGKRRWSGFVSQIARTYFFPYGLLDNVEYDLIGVDDNILFTRRTVFDPSHPATHIEYTYPAGTYDDTIIKDVVGNYMDLSGDDIVTTGVERVGVAVLDVGGASWRKGSPLTTAIGDGVHNTGEVAAASYTWKQFMDSVRLATGAIYYIDPQRDADGKRVLRYIDVETNNSTYSLSDAPIPGAAPPPVVTDPVVNGDFTSGSTGWTLGTGAYIGQDSNATVTHLLSTHTSSWSAVSSLTLYQYGNTQDGDTQLMLVAVDGDGSTAAPTVTVGGTGWSLLDTYEHTDHSLWQVYARTSSAYSGESYTVSLSTPMGLDISLVTLRGVGSITVGASRMGVGSPNGTTHAVAPAGVGMAYAWFQSNGFNPTAWSSPDGTVSFNEPSYNMQSGGVYATANAAVATMITGVLATPLDTNQWLRATPLVLHPTPMFNVGVTATPPVLTQVFTDAFTRTTTPGTGLGGSWTWNPYDSYWASLADSLTYVDGSELVVPSGYYDSYDLGVTTPVEGEISWDVYVRGAADASASHPAVGLNIPNALVGGACAYAYAYAVDSSGTWGLTGLHHPAGTPSVSFTPTPNAWMTVKARWHLDGSVDMKAWERGTAEPDWMLLGDGAWNDEARAVNGTMLDLYYTYPSADLLVDNIAVWRSDYVDSTIEQTVTVPSGSPISLSYRVPSAMYYAFGTADVHDNATSADVSVVTIDNIPSDTGWSTASADLTSMGGHSAIITLETRAVPSARPIDDIARTVAEADNGSWGDTPGGFHWQGWYGSIAGADGSSGTLVLDGVNSWSPGQTLYWGRHGLTAFPFTLLFKFKFDRTPASGTGSAGHYLGGEQLEVYIQGEYVDVNATQVLYSPTNYATPTITATHGLDTTQWTWLMYSVNGGTASIYMWHDGNQPGNVVISSPTTVTTGMIDAGGFYIDLTTTNSSVATPLRMHLTSFDVSGIGASKGGMVEWDHIAITPPPYVPTPETSYNIGYREASISAAGDTLCNDMMVWGAALGAPEMVFSRYQAGDSQADHGRWQGAYNSASVYRQTTADLISSSHVEGRIASGRGAKRDKLTVRVATHDPEFGVGEVVLFTCGYYGFERLLPVREATYTFPAPWIVRTELALTTEIDDPWDFTEFLLQTPAPFKIEIPRIAPFQIPRFPYCALPTTPSMTSGDVVYSRLFADIAGLPINTGPDDLLWITDPTTWHEDTRVVPSDGHLTGSRFWALKHPSTGVCEIMAAVRLVGSGALMRFDNVSVTNVVNELNPKGVPMLFISGDWIYPHPYAQGVTSTVNDGVTGATTRVSMTLPSQRIGQPLWMRVRWDNVNRTCSAKVWGRHQVEPVDWMLTYDANLPSNMPVVSISAQDLPFPVMPNGWSFGVANVLDAENGYIEGLTIAIDSSAVGPAFWSPATVTSGHSRTETKYPWPSPPCGTFFNWPSPTGTTTSTWTDMNLPSPLVNAKWLGFGALCHPISLAWCAVADDYTEQVEFQGSQPISLTGGGTWSQDQPDSVTLRMQTRFSFGGDWPSWNASNPDQGGTGILPTIMARIGNAMPMSSTRDPGDYNLTTFLESSCVVASNPITFSAEFPGDQGAHQLLMYELGPTYNFTGNDNFLTLQYRYCLTYASFSGGGVGATPWCVPDVPFPLSGSGSGYAMDTGDHQTYSLWSAFAAGSVKVYVNGIRQAFGTDYTLVPAAGLIVFNSPLNEADDVFVSYYAIGSPAS